MPATKIITQNAVIRMLNPTPNRRMASGTAYRAKQNPHTAPVKAVTTTAATAVEVKPEKSSATPVASKCEATGSGIRPATDISHSAKPGGHQHRHADAEDHRPDVESPAGRLPRSP